MVVNDWEGVAAEEDTFFALTRRLLYISSAVMLARETKYSSLLEYITTRLNSSNVNSVKLFLITLQRLAMESLENCEMMANCSLLRLLFRSPYKGVTAVAITMMSYCSGLHEFPLIVGRRIGDDMTEGTVELLT